LSFWSRIPAIERAVAAIGVFLLTLFSIWNKFSLALIHERMDGVITKLLRLNKKSSRAQGRAEGIESTKRKKQPPK
jgi:hypothetical protein